MLRRSFLIGLAASTAILVSGLKPKIKESFNDLMWKIRSMTLSANTPPGTMHFLVSNNDFDTIFSEMDPRIRFYHAGLAERGDRNIFVYGQPIVASDDVLDGQVLEAYS